MPTENTTSKSEATCSLPPSTSRANEGNCDRNTAPKNHIHEMPSSERNTLGYWRASCRLRQVSLKGFQFSFRPGSEAGEVGMRMDASQPSRATPRQAPATHCTPSCGMLISKPPATLPSKMATNVPISTRPLPPVSSRSLRCCGR
jgi:hypothetical protein